MQLSYLITIVQRSDTEKFIRFFREEDVPLAIRMLGSGTARYNIRRVLGLAETEKAVFMSVVPHQKANVLMNHLVTKMDLDMVGMGIAYTVPVSSIAGASTLHYLCGNMEEETEEPRMSEKKLDYELVVVITNKSYVDTVMDAAYEAGAGGGTVVHAHGAGSLKAKKFFGVSISPEKAMIYIVLKSSIREAVMKAIVSKAGMQTEAKSILFSVPVSDVAGLREVYRDAASQNS